jgi:hypothetical protein
MKAKICFHYGRNSVEIRCTVEEEMGKIFQRYADILNCDINNFDFFYESEKIKNDSTLLKLTGNKNIEKSINVMVERKSKIIKCPYCTINDTIIKIENYKVKFDGCK